MHRERQFSLVRDSMRFSMNQLCTGNEPHFNELVTIFYLNTPHVLEITNI